MAKAKDTVLSVQTGTSYVDIIGLQSVTTPNFAITDVESTVLASDGKEFEPGIEDGGSVSFACKHSDESFAQLTALRGTVTGYKVTFSDTNGFDFTGYLNKLSAKADGPDKLLVLEGEIKVSGVITAETAS